MTLRYDERGRPVGLDWPALSANCPQDPSVWSKASLVNSQRPGNKIPDETEAEIVRLHLAGASAAEIAAQTEVCTMSVTAVLDRRGVTEGRGRGHRQRTPVDLAERIVRLYSDDRLPVSVINEQTGVQRPTIYKILRRYHVELRSAA